MGERAGEYGETRHSGFGCENDTRSFLVVILGWHGFSTGTRLPNTCGACIISRSLVLFNVS